jgi:phosphatidate cytidylyltransferase
MTPHMKRWITGVVAVPILFGIIAYGGEAVFAVLILVVTLLGMDEYNRISFGKEAGAEKIATMIAALLILLTAWQAKPLTLLPVLAFSVMTVLILNLLEVRKRGLDMTQAGRAILGILYIPFLMAHLILIRQTPAGVQWVFFVLILAFAGDIAAFYVGRKFGKHKLYPEVSPAKTVEGIVGLVIGSVVGCLVFSHFFFQELPIGHAVVLGAAGSVLGQAGDLCESMLKRSAGVKDSGTLFPGHGGILDRLDCLMFIFPFVYYYQGILIR